MSKWLKYVVPLVSAFALMLATRALVVSTHSVRGNGLEPLFKQGDQLLINRCSYGMRIEGHGLLPYSRLMRKPVKKGDIVAFTLPGDSIKGVMIARCTAVPGDTIRTKSGTLLVPGLITCAKTDYYWLEALNRQNPVDSRHIGFIAERQIVGKVVTVLYNRKNIRLQ